MTATSSKHHPPYRVGLGYDLHRLDAIAPAGEGRPMILGGIRLPDSPIGPVGHSDGDVLLHAITDAILGGLALPDIGELFPDNDPTNEGRDSVDFLNEAVTLMRERGYGIANLDCTVVAERPKLKPIKGEIRENLAVLLGLDVDAVNVKGKTHERVDAIGEGRAIESHVAILLYAKDA